MILQSVFRENVRPELVEIITAVVRRSWPLVSSAFVMDLRVDYVFRLPPSKILFVLSSRNATDRGNVKNFLQPHIRQTLALPV